MQVFRGFHHPHIAPACALTIGNFDGVHRGHQAMLDLLKKNAKKHQVPSCVLTFEPHPLDYFSALKKQPRLAPARISTLRDKLFELARCGIDQTVVLPFNAALAAQTADEFISTVLQKGLGAKSILVGDDFRFGAQRSGNYAHLKAAAATHNFEVTSMESFLIRGQRASSSAVRTALQEGRMADVAQILGRPYSISGHVVHGRKLGRHLGESRQGLGNGFRTLNLRFSHWNPAASGIFVVLVHGLTPAPLQGVANLGVRPSIHPNDVNAGRVLLETHCFDWPAALGLEGAYSKVVRVELLHKLHDELKYANLADLTHGIAQDCANAQAFFNRKANALQYSVSEPDVYF